jgi:hypothetical protein
MKKLFLLLSLFLLVGCSPKPESKLVDARTGDVQRIYQVLGYFPYGANKTFVTSASYESIKESKIRALYDAWRQQLFDTNPHLIKYSESNDCDKFAFSFYSYVQNIYYELNYGIKGSAESFGVGIVFYRHENKINHAINVIITEDDILFFEPQTGEVVKLTPTEVKSIYLVIM